MTLPSPSEGIKTGRAGRKPLPNGSVTLQLKVGQGSASRDSIAASIGTDDMLKVRQYAANHTGGNTSAALRQIIEDATSSAPTQREQRLRRERDEARAELKKIRAQLSDIGKSVTQLADG